MFPNLELEMFKRKISTAQLAKVCGISEGAMCNKLKGRSEFKYSEMKKISSFLSLPWTVIFMEEGDKVAG